MSAFNEFWFQTSGGYNPGLIGNSLRFRGSQGLSRTNNKNPTSTTVCTFSGWTKISRTDRANNFSIVSGEITQYTQLAYSSSNNIETPIVIQTAQGPSVNGRWQHNAENRDPSAWYHIVMVYNSVPGGSKGIRIWRNGVEQGTLQYIDPNGNSHKFCDNGAVVQVGQFQSTYRFQGHMAELHFVDGQALLPTDFGEFNAEGVWMPKEVSGLNYGNNGWYLDFSDPNNIGADRSGNGNNFTPTGFELSNPNSIFYDLCADSPTNNDQVWNPLNGYNVYNAQNVVDANRSSMTSDARSINSTIASTRGSKLYAEIQASSHYGNDNHMLGIADINWQANNRGAGAWDTPGSRSVTYYSGGRIYVDNSIVANVVGYGNGDVIGIALDNDTRQVSFYKNNSLIGTYTAPDNFGRPFILTASDGGSSNCTHVLRPQPKYTPPAGYEYWTTSNLNAPVNPSEHFQTVLNTGANILNSATNTFSHGLYWIKDRVNTGQHQLVNSIDGTSKTATCPNGRPNGNYSAPSGNSVAFCWKTGAPESNTDGSINTTICRNVDAGFSIISYQSNGTSGATIGHGLSRAPEFWFTKARDGDANFVTACTNFAPDRWLALNAGFTLQSGNVWNNQRASDSVITLGNYGDTNSSSSQRYTLYAWHSVPGFSSFGGYTGTGNNDGPFIPLGFTPALAMVKHTDRNGCNWVMWATALDSTNPCQVHLYPSSDNPERTFFTVDLLSNGIKIRNSPGDYNGVEINDNGVSFTYAAWAQHPFGGSNVSPSPAR